MDCSPRRPGSRRQACSDSGAKTATSGKACLHGKCVCLILHLSSSLPSVGVNCPHCILKFLKSEENEHFFFFGLFRATPTVYGGSQARGPIGATAAGLHHSHSHAGSEPRLQHTPQLTTKGDSQPTEQGQGSNPHPQGSLSDSLLLHHNGNSCK